MLTFLMSNWVMVLIAVISGVLLCWPLLTDRVGSMRKLDPADAVQLMNRKHALLLDVREEKRLQQDGARIGSARHIPASQLEGRLSELKKFQNKPVIVQCNNERGAALACALLQKNGFADTYVLSGGLEAWEKAGLPLQRKAA